MFRGLIIPVYLCCLDSAYLCYLNSAYLCYLDSGCADGDGREGEGGRAASPHGEEHVLVLVAEDEAQEGGRRREGEQAPEGQHPTRSILSSLFNDNDNDNNNNNNITRKNRVR